MATWNPQANDLFLKALELHSPVERQTYLDGACASDAALRAEVEALLEANDQAGSFLNRPPDAIGATGVYAPVAGNETASVSSRECVGAVIGQYKLLQQIGEGGMGTVYMAEQTQPIQRKVALKIIKAGMDSKQVIARFEAERQALAMMDHVNIARVFDAGTTEAGRPYFVMELVHGVPITKYCDDNHLTPRERLELFVPVCQAIQHAHQKGIIHRDIKPSNVMVTLYDGKPVPKVIDFGVAKATEQKLTERTLFTQYGTMVGTLEYMSPEQAEMSALGVDTRSDIYSLGVLLYELLTGSTPLTHKRMKEGAHAEILRMIKEEDPPKPSTRLSDSGEALASISANRHMEPAKLTKLVRGELDWIVMKTLEKDCSRRYETANAFAADVQRYLADETVLACPPSAAYRLRKFTRRNKVGLAFTGLIVLILLSLTGGIGWTVRDQAAREAKVSGQVELILEDVERMAREQKWPEALAMARRAEAVLATGEGDAATAERVRELLKDLTFIDRLEQIRMQRATWADGTFGNFEAIGDYARAFRDYGVDVEALGVETSIDRLKARPALAIPLAAALDNWVFVRRLDPDSDVAGWKRVVAVARGIDPEPLRDRLRSTWGQPVSEVRDELRRLADSIDIRAQHPATLVSLARTLQRVTHSDSAVRLLRDAQYVYPGDFWLNFVLGLVLNEQKDDEGAIRYFTAAVSIRPNSAKAHNNLGTVLSRVKKLDEAIACYRKAMEFDPKDFIAHHSLGRVLAIQKKLDDAIAAYRKAIEINSTYTLAHVGLGDALRQQNHLTDAIACFRTAIELDPKSAIAYSHLGIALSAQQKLDEAIAAYRKAIELDPKYVDAYNNLGNALRGQKKWDEAFAAFHKAIEIDQKYAGAYVSLGAALHEQQKLDEAIAAYRKAIELDPKHVIAHYGLGSALYTQNKLEVAVAAYRKAIELDPKFANAHYNLGKVLRSQKRLDEASAAYRKAIELDPKHVGAYNHLGVVLYDQKNWDEAIAAYHKAIDIDPNLVPAHYNLGNVLCEQKKLDKAIAAYRKAIEIDSTHTYAHIGLGNALRLQNKLTEAIACFHKAIELDPKSAIAYGNLGLTLSDQKKLDEAIAAYCKAIQLDPKSGPAHSNLGNALKAQGKFDEAIDEHREALRIEPDSAFARNLLASALNDWAWTLATVTDAQKREPGRSLKLATEAVELAPKFADLWNTLGVAQYRAGNWMDAISTLQKSRELRTIEGEWSNPFFLAMAHWQMGNKAEARKWYDQATQWMAKNHPANKELRYFRVEAHELLGIRDHRLFQGHTQQVRTVAFLSDGSRALSAGRDKTIRLWDVASGKVLNSWNGHTAVVWSVVFSADGRKALSGSWDRTMRLWDVADGKELARFEHPNLVCSVAFSPDGKRALSGCHDKIIRLWDLQSGKELTRFEGHTDAVRSVAFAPDGLKALSGSHDKTVRLWDVATGKETRRFEGHTNLVLSVAFSSDGRQALSGGCDRALRLWDVETSKQLGVFSGHQSNIESVAFCPDGLKGLSGSADGTIRLWDLKTGRELHCIATDDVLGVAISSDGRQILSANADNSVRLWTLPDFEKKTPGSLKDAER